MPKQTQEQREDAAWKQIMEIAEEHAMIMQAYGGVATLVLPSAQREQGVRADYLHRARRWTMDECTAAAARGE